MTRPQTWHNIGGIVQRNFAYGGKNACELKTAHEFEKALLDHGELYAMHSRGIFGIGKSSSVPGAYEGEMWRSLVCVEEFDGATLEEAAKYASKWERICNDPAI